MVTVKMTEEFGGWLGKLDDEARGIIVARIERLRDGLLGDSKPVGDKVSEIRIHAGPGYRIYYTRTGKTVYILLWGGRKSDQKRDIKTAKKMAKEL
jgi:putative addiction module killer protein